MVLVLIPGLHLEKDASIGLHPEKRIISVQDPSLGPGGKCDVMGLYLSSVWEDGADLLHSVVFLCCCWSFILFPDPPNQFHCQFFCMYKIYKRIQILFYPHSGTDKLSQRVFKFRDLQFWNPNSLIGETKAVFFALYGTLKCFQSLQTAHLIIQSA